jgi:hypothetical protein
VSSQNRKVTAILRRETPAEPPASPPPMTPEMMTSSNEMGMPSAMAAWPITNPGTSAAMERRMLNCAYSR